MRTINLLTRKFQIASSVLMLLVLFVLVSCNNTNKVTASNDKEQKVKGTEDSMESFWHVKAIYTDGSLLNIIAVDGFGNDFEVKVIQKGNQKTLMNVKAIINGKILPVKLLVNSGKQTLLAAIAQDGTVYNIKAVAPNGDRLGVKGILRSGNIIHIKAVDKNGAYYGVKAISTAGRLHDIKGIKLKKADLEYNLYGSEIYAHVKAIPQTGEIGDNFLWHIVGVHPDGYFLDVKAQGEKGEMYDVNAIMDSDQRSLLNIKAFKSDTEILPVKILPSTENYKPVNAIGENGTIYKIVAIDKSGNNLAVKGVRVFENIIDIKVVNAAGEFYGVKAISQKGQMNDVKGMKMLNQPIETKIGDVEVFAHVKALPQTY